MSMDVKTLLRSIIHIPAEHSVLLKAGHGVGKSEVVAQLAEHFGLKLLDRRMSQTSEGDTIGLPKQTMAKGPDGKSYDITQFCPPEFVAKAKMEPCLLFLDELNRATPEVMQACFQYALDRCDFQGEKFHPKTRVFAAVNTGGNYQVNEMDPALLDRFWTIDFKPTDEDFFEHASTRPAHLGGPIDADLLRFLKERPSRLDPSDANPGTVQPSRRSWVRLDRAYRAAGVYASDIDKDASAKGLAYSLAVGYVGQEASSDLVDFLGKRETRFNATHVLDEYPKHRERIKGLGQDKLNTLIDLLVEDGKKQLWTKEQSANLGDFVGDVPAELRVSFIINFTKGLRNHAHFAGNFKIINPSVMPHIVHAFNPGAVMGGTQEAEVPAADTAKKPSKKK